MSLIEKKFSRISPSYLLEYEGFIKKYSPFGGGASEEKYSEGRSFSSVYELYMYAFFIGLFKGSRRELHPDDAKRSFWETENWKPKPLVACMLACAVAQSTFDMAAVEHMDEPNLNIEVAKVRLVIEEFANDGLAYLSGLLEKEPDLIDDDMLFIKLLAGEE